MRTVRLPSTTCIQAGIGRSPNVWRASSNGNVSTDCLRTVTMSNCSTRYDGTSTRLPLTSKWPCVTS